MTILTFADLHGTLPTIPKANRNGDTILAFCGDICPNNVDNFTPGIKSGPVFEPTAWNRYWNFRQIDKKAEAQYQNEWVEETFIPHLLKNNINLDNVIIVRGNHDWADFEKYFKHGLNTGSKTITINNKKIGLLCGVLFVTGEWQDEITESEIGNRIYRLDPDIEILISHAPPYGIRDRAHGQEHIGSQEIYKAIFGSSVFDATPPYFKALKSHCFGHAHGYPNVGNKKFEINDRQVKFTNSAETRILLEIL